MPVMQPEGLYVTTPGRQIPEDKVGVDIGRRTIENFSSAIGSARTIFWNGPMGVFERPPFDRGTRAVAEAVAGVQAFSVAGGGDTVAALQQTGLAEKLSHISTGGGASLEFLESGDLPGIAALRQPAVTRPGRHPSKLSAVFLPVPPPGLSFRLPAQMPKPI